jgi:hypothetical protein
MSNAPEGLRMTRSQRESVLATMCLLAMLTTRQASAQHNEPDQTTAIHRTAWNNSEPTQGERGRFAVGADLVIGFGGYRPGLPTRGGSAGFLSLDSIAVTNASLIASADYELGRHLALGLRIPFSAGSVPTTALTTRAASALGSLEINAQSEWELSDFTTLVVGLAAALPTAQGSEQPDVDTPEHVSDYNRFVVNRVAASARGFEENALFEVDRLRIIPEVALKYHAQDVVFEPFMKLENLIVTGRALDRRYIADLVVGTLLGYDVSEHFGVGIRAWMTAEFSDAFEAVGVMEPQFRWHFGQVHVVFGGIIPFAGALTAPMFGAFRLAFAAAI